MNKLLHLSASSLSCFKECPLKFHFNYTLKLLQLPNEAFFVGKQYHKLLEKFHSGRNAEIIIQNLKNEMLKKPTDKKIEQFGLLRRMFECYVKYPLKGNVIENELKFKINIPKIDVLFIGFLDRFDEDKIVEYKTSSFDYKESDIKTLQSLAYTYAMWKERGKILPVVYHIMNKKKVKQANHKPQEMSIQYTTSDLINFEQEAVELYNGMKKNIKDKKRGTHCFWCPWKKQGLCN